MPGFIKVIAHAKYLLSYLAVWALETADSLVCELSSSVKWEGKIEKRSTPDTNKSKSSLFLYMVIFLAFRVTRLKSYRLSNDADLII